MVLHRVLRWSAHLTVGVSAPAGRISWPASSFGPWPRAGQLPWRRPRQAAATTVRPARHSSSSATPAFSTFQPMPLANAAR